MRIHGQLHKCPADAANLAVMLTAVLLLLQAFGFEYKTAVSQVGSCTPHITKYRPLRAHDKRTWQCCFATAARDYCSRDTIHQVVTTRPLASHFQAHWNCAQHLISTSTHIHQAQLSQLSYSWDWYMADAADRFQVATSTISHWASH